MNSKYTENNSVCPLKCCATFNIILRKSVSELKSAFIQYYANWRTYVNINAGADFPVVCD